MVFGMYSRWVNRSPFTSQIIVASSTTATADWIVQRSSNPHDRPNMSRVVGFGLFGALYLGVAQHVIYVTWFSRLFGKEALEAFGELSLREKLKSSAGMKNVARQVALDFILIQPVVFWPSYYSLRAIVDTKNATQIPSYLSLYRSNFVEDNVGMCIFWLPADSIIYSLPLRWRLHASHLVQFVFSSLVSMFRGGTEKTVNKDGGKPKKRPIC